MVSTARTAAFASLLITAPFASGFGGFGFKPSKKPTTPDFAPQEPIIDETAIKAAELAKKEQELKVKNQGVLKDSAILSYGNSVFSKQLEQKGVYIDERGDKDFRLETPDGSFVFKKIAELEKGDFKARSMAIHNVNENGEVDKEPSEVSIAFGGPSKFSEIPKKFVAPSIAFPFEEKGLIKEMIRRTRYNFYYDYSKSIADKDVDLSVSAYSDDCKKGMSCHKELQRQGIESNLNLYEQKAPKITTGLVGAAIMAGVHANNLANIASAAIDGKYNSEMSKVSDVMIFDTPSQDQGRGMF